MIENQGIADITGLDTELEFLTVPKQTWRRIIENSLIASVLALAFVASSCTECNTLGSVDLNLLSTTLLTLQAAREKN